ncbi:F-box protein At5g07610 [Sorghum bicolor]|uniref:F-box protein At5g07610 n=1 Tax=Sorghum bicolor TaxID=4558 RepID=UPI0001A83126|nr:F-box protein At5g07610 [Sorghum bicolor]|eukprot:XP_002467650.1 F-box protein At5g07610 [Sorghum bicolor]
MEAAARDTEKKRSLAVTSSTAGGGVGLTDDLVVEILSRVPVKSICRFKCVSPSWRSLISHPDNRKKLPHTVTGFLYLVEFDTCSFVSLLAEPPRRTTGRGRVVRPRSPCDFLPANTAGGGVVADCCNGLVLLKNSGDGSVSVSGSGSGPRASYVVCNPATEKWASVPGSTHAGKICSASILCFEPAISLRHFHVVELLWWVANEEDENHCFNGLLHFITAIDGAVAALDMDGQTRSVIPVPRRGGGGFIGHSQGRLLYASRDVGNTSKLPIYVLLGEEGESNGSRWTLKHCVDTSGLVFTDADEYLLQSGLLVGLGVAAIHPHGDSIFLFDSLQGKLMSYSMDSQRAHVIRSVTKSPYFWSFLPYVPHYLETAALQNSN